MIHTGVLRCFVRGNGAQSLPLTSSLPIPKALQRYTDQPASPAFQDNTTTPASASSVLECTTIKDEKQEGVTLLNLNAPVAPEDATSVAVELMDFFQAQGVRHVVVLASLPIRDVPSGPNATRGQNNDAEDDDEEIVYTTNEKFVKTTTPSTKVQKLQLLPSVARLEDPLICALQALAALEEGEGAFTLSVIVCHGHLIRGQDAKQDKTIKVRFPLYTISKTRQ